MKNTVVTFKEAKANGEKLSMLTAYDYSIAKLIDECGLKGYTSGGAQVSTLHAGFVINIGNATAKDVLNVVNHIKQVVLEKTGKEIELEIELLGEGI